MQRRDSAAVGQAIVGGSATHLSTSAYEPETTAFEERVAAGRLTTRARDDVDGATDRVRAIQIRSRSAEDLDAVDVREQEIGHEARGVALGRGGIAERDAVDQDGCVLTPEPAQANRGL